MCINHLTDFPGQGIPVRSHFQITRTLGHLLECKTTPPRPGSPRAVSKNTQALNCQNEPPLLEALLMPSALQLPLLWPHQACNILGSSAGCTDWAGRKGPSLIPCRAGHLSPKTLFGPKDPPFSYLLNSGCHYSKSPTYEQVPLRERNRKSNLFLSPTKFA